MTSPPTAAAFAVEWLKFRRARTVQVATAVLVFVPSLLAAAFQAAAARGGSDSLSLKVAAMAPGPGWPGLLSLAEQLEATFGMGVGFVAAWTFGREFSDRAAAGLYAVPVCRERLVLAKFGLIAGWSMAVAVGLAGATALTGWATGLGPPDASAVRELGRLALLALLTGLLALPVGLVASVGRGYLPAFGGLFALVVVAQVVIVAGVGGWVPWSIPGLWATHLGVPWPRLLIVPVTSAAFVVATLHWWRRAEVR